METEQALPTVFQKRTGNVRRPVRGSRAGSRCAAGPPCLLMLLSQRAPDAFPCLNGSNTTLHEALPLSPRSEGFRACHCVTKQVAGEEKKNIKRKRKECTAQLL